MVSQKVHRSHLVPASLLLLAPDLEAFMHELTLARELPTPTSEFKVKRNLSSAVINGPRMREMIPGYELIRVQRFSPSSGSRANPGRNLSSARAAETADWAYH